MRYELGNARNANTSLTHGWIVGHMMCGFGKTDEFEVKLWHYDEQPDYPPKVFGGTECIVIYGGVLKLACEKDGATEEILLDGLNHEYVILEPGITKQVIVVEAPAFGVTIRWPSRPGINRVLQQ